MKLLLVDDDKEFLKLNEIYLQKEFENVEFHLFATPKQALKFLLNSSEQYDCIISDYQMPIMDGLEFLKVIRDKLEYDIPFIMFTGKGREEVAIEALNLGADRYFQKRGDIKAQYQVLAQAIQQEVNHYKTRKELIQSEHRFRKAIQEIPHPIMIHTEDGQVITVNEAWQTITGYKFSEISTIEKWIEKAYGKEQQQVKKHIKRLYTMEGNIEEGDYTITTKTGEKRVWTFSSTTLGLLADGRRAVLSIAKDSTERKRAEKRVVELYRLLNSIRDINQLITRTSSLVELQEKARDILLKNQVLIDANLWFDTFENQQQDAAQPACIKKVKRTKQTLLLQNDGICKDCDYCHHLNHLDTSTLHLPMLSDGRLNGILMVWVKEEQALETEEIKLLEEIANDLSFAYDKIRTEKQKHRVQQQYQTLFESSPYALVVIDPNSGRFLEANETAQELFKVDKQDLIGLNYLDFVPTHSKESYQDIFRTIVQVKPRKGYKVERELIVVDAEGNQIPIEIYINVINLNGNQYLQTTILDISERVKREKRLNKSVSSKKRMELKYFNLFEQSPDGIVIFDDQSNITDCNKAAYTQLEYSKEELLQLKVSDIDVLESTEEVHTRVTKIQEEGLVDFETIHVTKTGKQRHVYVISKKVALGKDYFILSIWRDITKHKQQQEQEEFLHTVLRHDVRNKAFIIQSYLQLALKNPKRAQEYIKKAQQGNMDTVQIIDKIQLLRKTEKLIGKMETLKLSNLIQKVLDNIQSDLDRAKYEFDITELYLGDEHVKAGPLITDLFLRIIENAIQHAHGSKIKFSSQRSPGQITFIIEDDGQGIPHQSWDEIFQRGYKGEQSMGSGLGLFLAKRISQVYNINVTVMDSPSLGGARFEITCNTLQNPNTTVSNSDGGG